MGKGSRGMEAIDIAEQSIADMSIDLIKVLLKDKTTGKYILWATDNYKDYGDAYFPSQEIKPELVIGRNTNIIQPRVSKSQVEQIKRTRDKAEVFTPSWICNIQNNSIDEAWFCRLGVFNQVEGTTWVVNPEKAVFPNGKKWQDYVDARRLEISCGEAPYLVSRYDNVTGMQIPLQSRIGILDRKIRIVNENTDNEIDWFKWVTRAFESTYGFEYQGDNVLLARENLLLTFNDYYINRTGNKPTLMQTKKIANIISWNIWQMDGISMTAPFSEVPSINQQMDFLDKLFGGTQTLLMEAVHCRIFDWRANTSLEFKSLKNGGYEHGR
ncbi:MAG: restriction endonuclease subunit M [Gudongella sp.]|nr:restriction endonuclease subunit M [Gudongella sp.]